MSNQKTIIQSEHSSFLGRTGGAYIPPAKLRQLQAQITDKSSEDYQRLTWEALKKSINGLINKVNVSNIKNIVPELFSENLIRGRGLLCRSLMKAQAASQPFTPVFAAVVSVINTKFPMIGELLIMRLLSQFRRAYKRSDKSACLSSSNFIAHLVNQRVANEIVALQILTLLLERPTDDSVEVAVGYMRQVGSFLMSESPKACNAVFERFRGILHEGQIDKRTQYMVEVLFQVRKDKFSDNPAIPEGLDIVEEEDQITHMVGLTDDLFTEDTLNVFKYDEEFLENEQKYEYMKREILGDDSDDEEEDDEGSSEEDEETVEVKRQLQIQDQTNTNLVNLRRAIYLTIMSSLNYEECAHKLLKLDIPSGQEIELCNMVIECCSQERTYVNFYGLLGERFCKLTPEWAAAFGQCFEETYKTIHRFETNRLRNIAKFFAHVLSTDGLGWEVFALFRITEADTTSSSRIFLKILFQDLVAALGIPKLKERLNDKEMVVTIETTGGLVNRGVFDGLFPKDNPRNTRFAINYFTSIGLGALTEELREYLKNQPKATVAASSSEDSETGSDSDSESEPDTKRRGRSVSSSSRRSPKHRSPSRERRNRSESRDRDRRRSRSRSRDRYRKRSRSPPRRRRSRSRSVDRYRKRSRSPPIRRRSRSRSADRNRISRRQRSPSPRRGHRSRSRTPTRNRYESHSRSPPRKSRRGYSQSRSRSADRHKKSYRRSPSTHRDSSRNDKGPKVHPSRLGQVPRN
jgi:pre-mRNA-splicing factor CWC22